VIVLDGSATIELLVDRDHGDWVADQLGDDPDIRVPHLLDMEVASGLRSLLARGEVSETGARRALDDYADLDVARYTHLPFLGRVWQLRAHITPYDAIYVALAELLQAPLVTTDTRLARAHGHRAQIVAP
jgi:predicted nucleic acid-binding protein